MTVTGNRARVVRLGKIALSVAIIALVVLVIVTAGALAYVTGRALPQTTGTLRVPGLAAPVQVDRDANGLINIRASNPHDLFLGQGYAHAQERMWQMEIWRHISSGRLSELFGSSQLDTDRFIRTVGWRRAAERDLATVSADTRAILDAYAEGVNAWLADNRDNLGLAFVVSGDDPEPWTAADSMAFVKLQAWNLGGNMRSEIFRYLADARLGDPARTDELFPAREFGPVITPTGLRGSGGAGADGPAAAGGPSEADGPSGADDRGAASGPAGAARSDRAERAATAASRPGPTAAEAAAWRDLGAISQALVAGADERAIGLGARGGIGSNNWVVGPSMSASGGALLANDPHLDISMPSVWIATGLHCAVVDDACPYDVTGVGFAGVPGTVLGHNARIAWGVTNVDPDVQDLVIETLDPTDPSRYIGPDGVARPFDVRTEELHTSSGETTTVEIRETIHGPILNDVDDRLEDAPLMALRWTSIHPDAAPDRTLEAFTGLMTAASYDDFRSTLSMYGGPAQNFVYADVDGHIGYQLPGYIPIRSDPADTGSRPVSGSDGSGEWVDRIPFDDLPSQLDPEPGWIVTANNAPVDSDYPAFLGAEWDPGYRAEQIIDLVNLFGEDGLTTPEMAAIQGDTAPLRARDVVFALEDVQPATEDGAVINERILDWDGSCVIHSVGCAAYMVWEYRLLRDIFDDELGDLARDYVGSPPSWVVLETLLEDPAAAWWDDTTTPDAVETAAEVLPRAMDEAGAELRAALGTPDRWTWGRLHTATFREGTLGESGIGPLEWYFNVGPVPVGGAAGSVNNASYDFWGSYPDPDDPDGVPVDIGGAFAVTSSPSYRLVIDMSDLDGARLVITTGQSGNPFDRHYGDLIDRWAEGELVPVPFTAAAIDAASVAQLTLSP